MVSHTRMRTVTWFLFPLSFSSFSPWKCCWGRPAGCHGNTTWARCVSLLYLKRVHDSEPREDVINTPWCLASIFQPVRKTRQRAQDFTPTLAVARRGGQAIWFFTGADRWCPAKGNNWLEHPSTCYEIMCKEQFRASLFLPHGLAALWVWHGVGKNTAMEGTSVCLLMRWSPGEDGAIKLKLLQFIYLRLK